MVTQILSFSRSGLSDFVLQRVTAVILAVYTVWVLAFFLGDVTYQSLVGFFFAPAMQIFSTLALFSTIAHAWIGMWTIGTDYIRPAHVGSMATGIRFVYQMVCVLTLFVYLLWTLRIIWQF